MAAELSDYQKMIKAKTIIDNMQLDNVLSDLSVKLEKIFNDAGPMATETTSKEEMSELINGIKQGTADNNKISRFLELAEMLKIKI